MANEQYNTFSSSVTTNPTTNAPASGGGFITSLTSMFGGSSGASSGAAVGGLDPVTAIANGIGNIFTFANTIATNIGGRRQFERDVFLAQLPTNIDHYQAPEKDNTGYFVAGALVLVIIILAVLAIMKKNKA